MAVEGAGNQTQVVLSNCAVLWCGSVEGVEMGGFLGLQCDEVGSYWLAFLRGVHLLTVGTDVAEQFLGVPVGRLSGTHAGIGSLGEERVADGCGIVEASAFRAGLASICGVVEDGSFGETLDGLAIIGGGIEGLSFGALLECRFAILVILVKESIFGTALALPGSLVVEGLGRVALLAVQSFGVPEGRLRGTHSDLPRRTKAIAFASC